MKQKIEIRHFHPFCGSGTGAKGFNRGHARIGKLQAVFRCIGGVDNNPAAIADFTQLTGVPGTVLDMFNREQYEAFHGHPPPYGWCEATATDIQHAAGNERPHIVFLSAPCKGFSGLLSQAKSTTPKYQALNALTLRGVWLTLEAFKDDPPELILFENVPRIATRGRHLLDQIQALLITYGYAVTETTHDCGELGGLAQSRKRFLMVARHQEKVPAFLYEPQKKPLAAVGDILNRMPLPGDDAAGPMHRVPRLQWKTWVRLAFVEAGSDWRSLNRLAVDDGHLRDFLIVPEYRAGYLGVNRWDQFTGTIAGRNAPTNGAFSVADPRYAGQDYGTFGVINWQGTAGTVTGQRSPGQGCFSVADPRPPKGPLFSKYAVTPWQAHTGTVIGGDGAGACAVADPRPGMRRDRGDHYLTGGHYGIVPWTSPSGAVSAAACHDNGPWSVADPRCAPSCASRSPLTASVPAATAPHGEYLPKSTDKLVALIQALDGTWHRPFTTLELAALQGLMDPEEYLELSGLSDGAWRERIGNAVPPPAAQAIASMMAETLLLAWSGQTFVLSATPVWVRPVAAALSLPGGTAHG